MPELSVSRLRAFVAGVTFVVALLPAVPAAGGPVSGFREDWTAGTRGWTGGDGPTNPGTGGVNEGDGGQHDGYLFISRTTPGHLGAYSAGTEYAGNWIAANIAKVTFCLNDVNAADTLEIHMAIGNSANLWQYNTGFHPPLHIWSPFEVDLTDSTKFTQIINPNDGRGFAAALQNVEKVHFRHDVAPYGRTPDSVSGDFGVDRFELVGSLTPVVQSTWGRIKRLYR